MKIGTRSILFGVHQFAWHPITVLLGWKKVHGKWPRWYELVAIVLHDAGYYGLPNMDGPEGQQHPRIGARWAGNVVFFIAPWFGMPNWLDAMSASIEAELLCEGHSCHYALTECIPVSDLYLPDKVSILYDPKWFYLLRAWLSGELTEYMSNCPIKGLSAGEWFDWYREKIQRKLWQYRREKKLNSEPANARP